MPDSSLPVCLRNFHYRIQNALITAQPACRPANFDLATYWEQSKVDFKAGLPTYYATLRVAPAAVERLNSGGRLSITSMD